MSKVFTTEFRYKGFTYAALVTTRASGADHVVYVQVDDKRLHHLLPDGELHFRISQGLRKAPIPANGANRELVLSIKEAVIRDMKPSRDFSDPY